MPVWDAEQQQQRLLAVTAAGRRRNALHSCRRMEHVKSIAGKSDKMFGRPRATKEGGGGIPAALIWMEQR